MSTRSRWVVLALVLAACSRPDAPASDRTRAWREDLRALATELPNRHKNAFFQVTRADWQRDVDALDRSLPTLSDPQVLAGLTRLVASIGDAHTTLGAKGSRGTYPVTFIWFDDGIFVGGADLEHAAAVGSKLVGIGSHSIDHVLATLTPLVAHDNAAGLHAQLPRYLADAGFLAGTDLAAIDRATFKLAAADGSVRDVELRPITTAPRLTPPKVLPLHLQGPATNYWNRYVDAERLIYFAYNTCADDSRIATFAEFAASTLAFVDQHVVARFVIDLRRNGGGNSSLLEPLIAGLAARPALAGRVFVIIGMHTFSSAVLNAIDLRRRLHATLVGGPTAGRPSHYGEVETFALPRSKLTVQYSTKFFATSDLTSDAVRPDLPVTVVADDWFSGRDPAMDAVLAAPLPPR